MFRYKQCRRTFNERTSTPFNFIEVPTDIIFQVLFCRVRYKLSCRDVADFFCCEAFSSPMKPFATGRNGFSPTLSNSYERNAKKRWAKYGLWTKLIFE